MEEQLKKVKTIEILNSNSNNKDPEDDLFLKPDLPSFTLQISQEKESNLKEEDWFTPSDSKQSLSPYTNIIKKIEEEAKEEKSSFPLMNGPQVVRERNVRKKVALEPGYSPLDWARLIASGKNLRGDIDDIRGITLEELKTHNKESDVWCAFMGKVYNITPYLKFHPGGVKQLMKGAGKDATKLYNKVHPWVNIDSLLANCFIGFLIDG